MDRFEVVLENMRDELCNEFMSVFKQSTLEELEDEKKIEELFITYPFVELYYVLNKDGIQLSNNYINPIFLKRISKEGKGLDRSDRIYYKKVIEEGRCVVTKPYKSISSPDITATVAIPIKEEDRIEYIICLDLNLKALEKMFEKNVLKTKFEIFTKLSYGIFSLFLILIALKLTFAGVYQIFEISFDEKHIFESVILITLSIAIFDLAKTIFEEEVILYKDPRRHSEIRKTITRFLASIIIAVSIEALMLVFKFTISDPSKLLYALGLFFGIGFLIVSLGLYVFLGSKAEISIKRFERDNR